MTLRDDPARADIRENALLLIGHPGHELRVLGWLAEARPTVCVLTDGSGSDDSPRIELTQHLITEAGARIGPLFGELSDRQVYQYMLDGQSLPLQALSERITAFIVERDISMVVSDAVEGYNPTHDLCEVLARSAVAAANRQRSVHVRHYVIPLMGDPRLLSDTVDGATVEVALSAPQLERKLQAIRAYAAQTGPTLQQEVEDTFRAFGEAMFGREYLFTSAREPNWELRFGAPLPHYETHGEKQVAAGRYASVIRFREHMLPLMRQLADGAAA
jgi:LmbE family N-acetylglucosaminyl deacetylase